MEGPRAAAGGDVSLHNFSARLWEQLVHFHVMRLTDSLFLWVGATPHLRNLAVAMCNRYVSAGFHPRVYLPPRRHFRHQLRWPCAALSFSLISGGRHCGQSDPVGSETPSSNKDCPEPARPLGVTARQQ
ncbi:proteasome assembly chaperone 4 isoform X1 [Halichoerus grypus]